MNIKSKAFIALAAIALALIPQAGAQNTNPIHFTEIAAGVEHTLALKSDGTVLAWGGNWTGQSTVPSDLTNVVAIAAGESHSLALKSGGSVVAWGQMWNGSAFVTATVPDGLTGVVAIAAGYMHSLALKSGGTVVCWGDNRFGQSTPPTGLSNVVAIAGGGDDSLALKSDGTVVAWGYYGQNTVPPGLTGVIAVSAGGEHSLALKSDGTVVGLANSGQATAPVGLIGVVAISAGAYHNLALKSDGTVVGWGSNGYGEATAPVGLTGVVAISARGYHSLALKSDGTVMAWGENSYGESTAPQPLIAFQPASLIAPSGTTANFSVVVTGFAPLSYQWLKDGTNIIGATNAFWTIPDAQTNDAGSYSVVIANAYGSAISSNAFLTVALVPPLITQQPQDQAALLAGVLASFSVSVTASEPLGYQWRKDGLNLSGATDSTYAIAHVQTNDAGSYSVIVTNAYGSVTSSNAILTVTRMFITQQPQNTPGLWTGATAKFRVLVSGTEPLSYQWSKTGTNINGATDSAYTISNVQTNDAGSYSVIITNAYGSVTSSNAILTVTPWRPVQNNTPGTVVSWGMAGQSTVPDGLIGVVAIAAGGYLYPGSLGNSGFHSLALKSNGTVVTWGYVGSETGGFPIEPVPDGLNGVVAISASDFDSLALRFDGTVVAWGENFYGETNTVPDGLSNIVAIAGGGGNNLALKSDGTVVAWGYNDQVQSMVPTGLTDVVAIAAAGGHNLALKSDGTVVAWGGNTVPDGLSNVVAIAAGDVHSLALKSDGTVVAWGDNLAGECTVPPGLTGVIAIAAAGVYDDWEGRSLGRSLALKSDGTVVAWGDNEDGAFTVPGGLTGAIAIAAGGYQSLALVAGTNQITAPTIFIQARGNSLLLSWPAYAQGSVLQSTTNLADTNSWTTLTNFPVTLGSQSQVTDIISGPAKFYRLKK